MYACDEDGQSTSPLWGDEEQTRQTKQADCQADVLHLINQQSRIEDTRLDRKTLRRLVKYNNIAAKTGLSAGFVDQCIDKVLWAWRSHKDRYKEWRYRYDRALEELRNAGDDEREKMENRVKKLEKSRPSPPVFDHRVSCRFDCHIGAIQHGENSLLLWMHISALEKGVTMDVPLNPSHWHLKQLEGAMVDDFKIIQKNGEYYAHIIHDSVRGG